MTFSPKLPQGLARVSTHISIAPSPTLLPPSKHHSKGLQTPLKLASRLGQLVGKFQRAFWSSKGVLVGVFGGTFGSSTSSSSHLHSLSFIQVGFSSLLNSFISNANMNKMMKRMWLFSSSPLFSYAMKNPFCEKW